MSPRSRESSTTTIVFLYGWDTPLVSLYFRSLTAETTMESPMDTNDDRSCATGTSFSKTISRLESGGDAIWAAAAAGRAAARHAANASRRQRGKRMSGERITVLAAIGQVLVKTRRRLAPAGTRA